MSKTYRLHYTPEFFDDLRDIYSYIAFHFQEKKTAQNQVGRIKTEIKDFTAITVMSGWKAHAETLIANTAAKGQHDRKVQSTGKSEKSTAVPAD